MWGGSAWSKGLVVDIAGQDVINHAGAAAFRIIADRTGLTSGVSRALARRGFVPVHDRGRVLKKELAAGTVKGTFGHYPLEAWCENTGESLALLLRKGSAGSTTTTDHIAVLTEAIAQLLARYRRDLLITTDGAGASHDLVDHITTLNARPGHRVHYSIGWELTTRERTALSRVPAGAWGIVLDSQGQPRDPDEAGVTRATALLREGPRGDQLANWPQDLRIIARREKSHPGAQLSLFEAADGVALPAAGHQHPVPRSPPPAPRPRRGEASAPARDTCLGHLPSTVIEINRA